MAAIQDFDRRWIFLAIGVLVTTLFAFGTEEELTRSEYVDAYYATIEALPEGSVVMLSADFDPASAAELLPAYTATIHHLLKRGLKVVTHSHGRGITEEGRWTVGGWTTTMIVFADPAGVLRHARSLSGIGNPMTRELRKVLKEYRDHVRPGQAGAAA